MNSITHYPKKSFSILLAFSMIFSLISFSYRTPIKVNAETEDAQWNSILFGQSTSKSNSSIDVDDENKTVTITAGTQDGSKTSGKITGSHDGIAYYYTEVDPSKNFQLSADVKVNFFAKETPDKQEGFGIMARDAIGNDGDSTVFASNMVMVGGYSGSIQSVFRNNVTDASGAGAKMEGLTKFDDRPANDGTATYKLTLKKTNTGYQVSVNDGTEKIYYRPKQLEVLNSDKIYVGFFAARVASITVSNIDYKTSDATTDEPGKPEPSTSVKPVLKVNSPTGSATENYSLSLQANVKGNIEIKQADQSIYSGAIDANNNLLTNATLAKGDNTFDIVYTPDENEDVTSKDPISSKYVVTYKTYGTADAIYVSPKGTADGKGTEESPTDIYSAVKFIGANQTIYVHGGTYDLTTPINIEKGNNGTNEKPKTLLASPKEKPLFNFGENSGGINVAGDYWKVSGLDITKSVSSGLRVSGNHNVVELVKTYANGDTGMQISGSSYDSSDKWPTYNLILNCESYDNKDVAENNADGFGAKLTCGVGNVFRGCISHNNCDDGWDLYSKLETGPIGAVTVENCVAYGNGTLSDGTKTKGDGNGFKLGGEGLAVKHVLRNCLSFNNNSTGITSNSDPAIIVENCTSVDNGKANFSFAYYTSATPAFTSKNNISFRTKAGEFDNLPAALASDDSYFYLDTASKNASGTEVKASDFKSVTKQASVTRSADNNISIGDFMVLTATSKLKGGANLLDFSNITTTSVKADSNTTETQNK